MRWRRLASHPATLVALLVAGIAAWLLVLRDPLPDVTGSWVHEEGARAWGAACTIGRRSIEIDGVARTLSVERTEEGIVILRAPADQPGVPIRLDGDRLEVLGGSAGTYRRAP